MNLSGNYTHHIHKTWEEFVHKESQAVLNIVYHAAGFTRTMPVYIYRCILNSASWTIVTTVRHSFIAVLGRWNKCEFRSPKIAAQHGNAATSIAINGPEEWVWVWPPQPSSYQCGKLAVSSPGSHFLDTVANRVLEVNWWSIKHVALRNISWNITKEMSQNQGKQRETSCVVFRFNMLFEILRAPAKQKHTFLHSNVEENLAKDMISTLPIGVINIIYSSQWKGGPLLVLESNPLGRPSSATLAKNFVWLMPFVKDSPSKARDQTKKESFQVSKYILKVYTPNPSSFWKW